MSNNNLWYYPDVALDFLCRILLFVGTVVIALVGYVVSKDVLRFMPKEIAAELSRLHQESR